jgi:hypothetical protein
MYESFHLENDNRKVYQLVKQTNVFDNLLNTKNKIFLFKKKTKKIAFTFVHLYNQPRISSFPLATDGVVDCICNGCKELTGGGTIPLPIATVFIELGRFCMDAVEPCDEVKLD